MKAIFVHDHIFTKCKGRYYSRSLTKEVLQRYTNVFEELSVVTRGKEVDQVEEGLHPSNMHGIEFVTVPNFKSLKKLNNIIRARKIIKNEVMKADYVIIRTSTLGNIAVKYARKYNKPYLIEVVGCIWDATWNYSFLGKVIAPFAYINQKNIVKNSAYVIYVTNEFLQSRYPTNGKSVSCSNVALKSFEENVLQRRLKKIKQLTKDSKMILGTAAAVDVKYKGQQYVIEAMGRLKKEGKLKFKYEIVGAGEQDYLKSIAEKYGVSEEVRFLGALPHEKVFEWLENIDIYIQPSRQEGLPRSLIEAMSKGGVALGAKTAGIPELLDKKYIFSNSSKNIDEICEILETFNKEIMIEQAKRNYQESKKYDKAIIEKRRNDFLEDFKLKYKKMI